MAPARVLLPINNIKGDPVNIAIKEYKRITAAQYERAALLQRAGRRLAYNGVKLNYKYNLDALIIIDGNLYLMDESERRN